MRTLTCPHCFAKLKCPKKGGVTLRCSACSEHFTTPYPKAPLARKEKPKSQKAAEPPAIVSIGCLIVMVVLGLFGLKGCSDYKPPESELTPEQRKVRRFLFNYWSENPDEVQRTREFFEKQDEKD